MSSLATGAGSSGSSPRPATPGPSGSTSVRRQSPRYGERVMMALLAGAGGLSVLVTIGIVVALLFPAIEFFREISVWDFLTGTRWAPTFADPSYGVAPADHRNPVDDGHRPARGGAGRPRGRHLPGGVRRSRDPQGVQAGPGGAGRDPFRGLRLLRPRVRGTCPAQRPAARRGRHLQRAGRRPGAGCHDHPHHRVPVRGLA